MYKCKVAQFEDTKSAQLGSYLPTDLGMDPDAVSYTHLVSAALVFGGNLLANILYGVLDPRMRVSEGLSLIHI